MYPQLFLKTFWELNFRPQVFVAMSFSPRYENRFREIIEPAINDVKINGISLKAYRVDISKSGDSILSDIIDGIAHSELFFADISTIGKDSVTGEPYRNGNVLYEVGLALACRQSSEVLLVRDDRDSFLFDVSTIPHLQIDFTDVAESRRILTAALIARLHERNSLFDARVRLVMSSLTAEEVHFISSIKEPPEALRQPMETHMIYYRHVFSRLMDKQVVMLNGWNPKGEPLYVCTELGRQVWLFINSNRPTNVPEALT